MGPITLFDKSFLQSLSLNESVWFDHFFYPNICPLFYVETLADLTKTNQRSGRSAEEEVRIIADKTPVVSGGPCVHHRELCIANLLGMRVAMRGQIPVAGARGVEAQDGKKGVVYDASPESQAFSRWQRGEFAEIERNFAGAWRDMLTELNLEDTAKRMRSVGIDSSTCKSIEQAHASAMSLVRSRAKPFEQMALLFAFVNIPRELHREILERWAVDRYRPLADYAPYAAHVLAVELFFQIALATGLISAERPSNRIDVGYLFYLPFCMVFTSSDKLHRRCATSFLRKDQEFVWGPDLKAELARLNRDFAQLPEHEREKGIMKFARRPTGADDTLIVQMWDRHLPGWRSDHHDPVEINSKVEEKLVSRLREVREAPSTNPDSAGSSFNDPDSLTIQRFVPKKKGDWWLLPKDLKTPPLDVEPTPDA
jgi:hypothetical protein